MRKWRTRLAIADTSLKPRKTCTGHLNGTAWTHIIKIQCGQIHTIIYYGQVYLGRGLAPCRSLFCIWNNYQKCVKNALWSSWWLIACNAKSAKLWVNPALCIMLTRKDCNIFWQSANLVRTSLQLWWPFLWSIKLHRRFYCYVHESNHSSLKAPMVLGHLMATPKLPSPGLNSLVSQVGCSQT